MSWDLFMYTVGICRVCKNLCKNVCKAILLNGERYFKMRHHHTIVKQETLFQYYVNLVYIYISCKKIYSFWWFSWRLCLTMKLVLFEIRNWCNSPSANIVTVMHSWWKIRILKLFSYFCLCTWTTSGNILYPGVH